MADRGRVGNLTFASKRCAQKVWRREYEMHKERVKGAKARSDMSAPVTVGMEHLKVNLKKERLLEERYVEIDRENRELLRKMGEAMRAPPTAQSGQVGSNKGPTSLNRETRKKELVKITQENQRLLKAIQKAQPVYSARKWEDNYKQSEKLLQNCSAYPVITRMPRSKSESSVLHPISPEVALGQIGGERSSPGASSSMAEMQMGEDFATQQPNEKFVLKEGTQIGSKYYLLEMSTDGRSLNISAYDGETQSSHELILNEKKHRRLHREFEGDYSKIAGLLRVDGNRLILDGPESV